ALDRHQLRVRRHPRDTFTVSGALRDGPGDVRAMAVVVARVVVAADEIVSLDDARQIEVVDREDAGIDDGDSDALAARRVPRAGSPGGLPVPLLGEVRVIREPERLVLQDWFRPADVLTGPQRRMGG